MEEARHLEPYKKRQVCVICKRPECGYQITVQHLGTFAEFDDVDAAVKYIKLLRDLDAQGLWRLLNLPSPQFGIPEELPDVWWHECPKCFSVFPYFWHDHFVQVPRQKPSALEDLDTSDQEPE